MLKLNKATLTGYLGEKPLVFRSEGKKPVAKASLAVNVTWKKRNGENAARTDWFRLDFYNHLVSIAERYLEKGSYIYVEGRLVNQTREDKNGEKKSSTQIIVEKLKFLDKKIVGEGIDWY